MTTKLLGQLDIASQVLLYLLRVKKHATALSLVKLLYLIDRHFGQTVGYSLTGCEYRTYSFGVWLPDIFDRLESLISQGLIRVTTNYTRSGLEYMVYGFSDDRLKDWPQMEVELIEKVTGGAWLVLRALVSQLLDVTEQELTKLIKA